MIVIAGQGLAGTALAWHLSWRGVPFRIGDRGDLVTSSKIAAGIINPVTGRRLAVDPDFDSYFDNAARFYRRVEAATGVSFFHLCGAARILRDSAESQGLLTKTALHKHIAKATISDAIHAPLGAFGIPAAARLDVPAYLAASRIAFGDAFRLGVTDTATVDCTGIAAVRDGRLPEQIFQPAKGEILTLRIPDLNEDRIVNRGIWLARLEGELYRAGATYCWNPLDDQPSAMGRDEICSRVTEFLKLPFEVTAHDAATRPIARDRRPIVAEISQGRWAFNGLGSKGALWAPRSAERLAQQLTN